MTEEQIQEIERIKKRVDWFGSLGLPESAKLIKAYDTLQQQNKQLIEENERLNDIIKAANNEHEQLLNDDYSAYSDALQQIQGNKT